MSCFFNQVGIVFGVMPVYGSVSLYWFVNIGYEMQALVNVGCDLAKLVPGRVSTEIDARLAYDTHGIISKV